MLKAAPSLNRSRNDAIVFLMYHELEVYGRPLRQSEAGYARYVVREPHFREQMNWLQSMGMRGLSVPQALQDDVPGGIVITFDDGCETDLAVAAPILHNANFGATFYITLGYLGRRGYLVESQVRALSDGGFDIGCHSMTHPYLTELDDARLKVEMVEAKQRLEQMIGRPVHHFSCPGGRWSPKVAEVARRAGYHSVTTSRVSVNRGDTDPFELARIAVMRGTELTQFQQVCSGRGLWSRQFRSFLQTTAYRILGNTFYNRLRSQVLGDSSMSPDE
jgi:peptidoglycan/xylan/chitin deacetylase (PgdA/CDA1 family)